jgi:hypothetical protein
MLRVGSDGWGKIAHYKSDQTVYDLSLKSSQLV